MKKITDWGKTICACFRKKESTSHLSGGFFLIMLGIIFLLNNLGLLPWDVWNFLWKMWPLFLILSGLEILFDACFAWLIIILLMEVGLLLYLIFIP
jgi:hypothetical protein